MFDLDLEYQFYLKDYWCEKSKLPIFTVTNMPSLIQRLNEIKINCPVLFPDLRESCKKVFLWPGH